MTIHEYLAVIALEIARQRPDPRTVYAAGFRLGLEIGLRKPELGGALAARIELEIASRSLRPRDQLDREMAERVESIAQILRGAG